MLYKTRLRQNPRNKTSQMVDVKFHADNTGGHIRISINKSPFTDIADDGCIIITHGNYLTWDDYTKAPLSAEEIYNRFVELCQKWIRARRSHLNGIRQVDGQPVT